MNLAIELGHLAETGECGTCGHSSITFRGFVYESNSALAAYLCSYTESHQELGLAMAISLRGWGDGADETEKECVALEWQMIEGKPGCMVVDATCSHWADSEILGRLLSREEAMASGRAQEAFEIADAIWDLDERLKKAIADS